MAVSKTPPIDNVHLSGERDLEKGLFSPQGNLKTTERDTTRKSGNKNRATNPTAMKKINIDDFISSCGFNLDSLYPRWKENGNGKVPICIPAASDVCYELRARVQDPEAMLKVLKEKRRETYAKQALHEKLQGSDIGGIVIQDIKLNEVNKKLEKLQNYQTNEISREKDCQIDFILLHPEYGVVAFECRAKKVRPDEQREHFFDIFKQVDKQREKLQTLFRVLTNTELDDIPVSSIICFVNGDDNGLNAVVNRKECAILFEDSLSDQTKFNFTLKMKLDLMKNISKEIFFADENFRHFVAVLFGIRESKFTNLSCNAMAIYQMITTQIAWKEPSIKKGVIIMHPSVTDARMEENVMSILATSSGNIPNEKADNAIATRVTLPNFNQETSIFLNSEQHFACECYSTTDSNLVISGPPGSGKTLLLLLMVQAAAAQESEGRILVFLPSNALAILYHNFLLNCKNKPKRRTIIINPSMSDMKIDLKDNDDIFADEVFSGFWIPQNRDNASEKELPTLSKFFDYCKKIPSGKTVVAVTVGHFYDAKSLQSIENVLKERLSKSVKPYIFIKLKNVMRCTRNIYDYCKKLQPDSEIQAEPEQVGHEIRGQPVLEIKGITFNEAKELIREKISEWTRGSRSSSASYSASDNKLGLLDYRQIAIIVAHEPVGCQIGDIKRYLRENDILCGSVEEQQQNQSSESPGPDLVAVDSSRNVLSLAWCVVIVLDASNCFYSKCLTNPIVPVSRAVSTLVVLRTVECGSSGRFWDHCPNRTSIVLDSLRSIFKSSMKDSLQKRENALIKSLQKAYKIVSLVRIIAFLVFALGIAITALYMTDYDVLFLSVMATLFLINFLMFCLMWVASSSEWLLAKHAVETEAAKQCLVALAIIIGIGFCFYYYNDTGPFFVLFVIILLICLFVFVASYLLKLSPIAFVAFESRKDFGLMGTFRNTIIAQGFCALASIFVTICTTYLLSLDMGFKFILTLCLAILMPIAFVLLTQDDVKPLLRRTLINGVPSEAVSLPFCERSFFQQ